MESENTPKNKMEIKLESVGIHRDNTIGDIEERKLGSKVLIMTNEGLDKREIIKEYRNYMDKFLSKKSNRNYPLNKRVRTELKKYMKNDK